MTHQVDELIFQRLTFPFSDLTSDVVSSSVALTPLTLPRLLSPHPLLYLPAS